MLDFVLVRVTQVDELELSFTDKLPLFGQLFVQILILSIQSTVHLSFALDNCL